ncbi:MULTISPECIES: TetR/AcrR family transcriptional regulator [unclassified Rhizobium]|uniref:TetR/AcrR family transcriptional regulator n=1 Tax=unclassified Rhizobium TaxID=2613769 RepID=UPI000CDF2EF0|nr:MULTISPECIES: TetR/AcrR family transcriptional regulator [Rhizobium]AVA20277.1 TetR family transcriptional regulator protein [Rhizobium sp. NXC24]UWU21569.1 TetR/AcrR family transcriptional regulator [Rhizobium tropici]
MNSKENPRPGGRSARVQAAVHQAVREMLAGMERADVTIPLIAQRANVTPSTIYRRWGDLQELLADVAASRLQPETEPLKTGSARMDLQAWAEQYADEMSSGAGRQMIRDILAVSGTANAEKCSGYTQQQVRMIVARAKEQGAAFPTLTEVMDFVISPIMYRILFDQVPSSDYIHGLISRVMPKDAAKSKTAEITPDVSGA